MRESILTIPINEIFEQKCGCPFCQMRDMLENRCVEYIMGAAMMEPDIRIETNKQGFCKTHFEQMLKQKNRLSLALMLKTHLDEISSEFFKKTILNKSKKKEQKINEINTNCFVCSKVNWGMERLITTFFEMYEKNSEFKDLFNNQDFICINHYQMLMENQHRYLNKKNFSNFKKDCDLLVQKHLDELKKDVEKYCSMYDYRNADKNADWENSKDAIERAIKFLTTR